MTTLNPPTWLQNAGATHTAQNERLALGGLVSQSGMAGAGQMTVTQRAAGANMSVDVAGGTVFIKGTSNTYQGVYSATNDGTVNLVLNAADLTNPRRDIVIARINDSVYTGAANSWTLEVVTGTPAASPVDPTLPASSLKLASILVAANATTVVNANITNQNQLAASKLASAPVVCTSTTRPTVGLFDGMMIYETDTDVLAVYEGSTWVDISPRRSGVVTNALTPSTGFSITSQGTIKMGRMVQTTAVMVRTGATLAASSTGNITNVSCAALAAGYRPSMTTGWSSREIGSLVGGVITSSGACVVASLVPNVSLATGASFSWSASFIQVG